NPLYATDSEKVHSLSFCCHFLLEREPEEPGGSTDPHSRRRILTISFLSERGGRGRFLLCFGASRRLLVPVAGERHGAPGVMGVAPGDEAHLGGATADAGVAQGHLDGLGSETHGAAGLREASGLDRGRLEEQGTAGDTGVRGGETA